MKKIIFKNLPIDGKHGIYNFSDDAVSPYYFNDIDSVGQDPTINDKFLNRDLFTYTGDNPLNENILNKNVIHEDYDPNNEGSSLTINELTIKNRGVNHKIRHGFVSLYLFSNGNNLCPSDSAMESKSYTQLLSMLDTMGSYNENTTSKNALLIYHQGGRRFKRKSSFGNIIESSKILENLTKANTVGDSSGHNTFLSDWSTHIPKNFAAPDGEDSAFNPQVAFGLNDGPEEDVFPNNQTHYVYILAHMGGNAKRWGKVKRRRKRINVYKMSFTPDASGNGNFLFDLAAPFIVKNGPGKRTAAFDVRTLNIRLILQNDLFNNAADIVNVQNDITPPVLIDINRNFETNMLNSTAESQILLNDKDCLTQIYNLEKAFTDTGGNWNDIDGKFAFGRNWALRTTPEFYDFNVLPEIKINNTDYNLQNYYTDTNDTLKVSTPNKVELSIKIANMELPDFPNDPIRGIELSQNEFSFKPYDQDGSQLYSDDKTDENGNHTIKEEEFKRLFYVVSWNDSDDEINWDSILDSAPTNSLELSEKQNKNIYIYKRNQDKLYHNYSAPGMKKIKLVVASYRHINATVNYESLNYQPYISDYDYSGDTYYASGRTHPTIPPTGNSFGIIQPIRWKLITATIFLTKPINQFPDFGELGGGDFVTIPWPHVTPVIGGVSKDSNYIKSVKSTLDGNNLNIKEIIHQKDLINALRNDEIGQNIQKMDLEQCRYFNTSYSISELLNIDIISEVGNPNSLDIFYNPTSTLADNQNTNTSPEYLATLPFPQYIQEFDFNENGEIDFEDAGEWGIQPIMRPDISDYLFNLLVGVDNPTGNYYIYPDYVYDWNSVDDIPNGIVTIFNSYKDDYWDGETTETTFSEESSVGQIFISDNQDVDLKQNCKLEINTGNLTGKSIYDSSGNSNKGMLIGDYKVKKQRKNKPIRRDSFIKVPKKTGNTEGAL